MARLKHFLCVWICCSAVACAEEHRPAAHGDDSAPPPGASSNPRGDEAAAAPDAGGASSSPAHASADADDPAEPGAAAGDTSNGATLLEPRGVASALCGLYTIDLSSPNSSPSLTGPCSFRGNWKTLSTDAFNVLVDGVLRASGASDGFRVETDHVTITLLGAACTEALGGATVTVELLCEILPLW